MHFTQNISVIHVKLFQYDQGIWDFLNPTLQYYIIHEFV